MKKRIEEMTISGKLRFVNSIVFFVPMLLAMIGLIFMFSYFNSDVLDVYLGKNYSVDNIDYAYNAFVFVKEEYPKLLENGDDNPLNMFPEIDEFGTGYVEVKKDGNLIYSGNDNKPDDFDEIYEIMEDSYDDSFRIINGKIAFKVNVSHNNSEYEFFATGNIRKINPYKKDKTSYLYAFLIDVVLILAVIFLIHFLSKMLNRVVFKRVEYSLGLLNKAVEQVGEGNLDYRIEYDRNDEFKPICDSFNYMVSALKESTDEVKKNEQTRKELLMSISHDIFSPLTSITAYAEGIIGGIAKTREAELKYAEVIKKKALEIENMVSSLLFLSKLEYGDVSYSLEKIRLNELVNDYVKSVDTDYAIKNLQVTVSETEEVSISGEEKLLIRLFNNLLDNSVKYKNKAIGHVEISVFEKDGYCNLIFKDDGPGVAEENIEKIFELFYRSDETRNSGNGNGIGLSIVNNIVRIHNGSVEAKNVRTGGLEITIRIPVVKEG